MNSFAKIMQTSVMRTCSQIAECSLSYAKIQIICDYMVCFSLHLYLILAPITPILKSVQYLVDNQWATSVLKFLRKFVARGPLLEEIYAKIYWESNVTVFPSYNKCVLIWPLPDGESNVVAVWCLLYWFSTWPLYFFYKRLVLLLQRPCTNCTKALY